MVEAVDLAEEGIVYVARASGANTRPSCPRSTGEHERLGSVHY